MAALRGARRSSFLLRLGSVEGLDGSEVDLLASGASAARFGSKGTKAGETHVYLLSRELISVSCACQSHMQQS